MSDTTKTSEFELYKNNDTDIISWVDNSDVLGERVFTFDEGKTLYNMFADYPHNMTPQEVEIFDRENPYWANFFRARKK